MTVSTSRDSDKFMLRFPGGMRDRLKQVAAENGRSMNAEIIYRLQTTLEMDEYVPQENIHTDDGPDRMVRLIEELLSMARRYTPENKD